MYFAYTLLAMAKHIGKEGVRNGLEFSYRLNNSAEEQVSSKAPLKQVETNLSGAQNGTVLLKNKSKGMLYARIVIEGIPKTGDQISSQSNLEMKVVYKDMDGKSLTPDLIAQGTDFYAEVSVTN